MSSEAKKPRKSRDAERTRNNILEAAKIAFSERGYGQVGVREIAAMAGVDASLVNRYFGSKQKLFEAALKAVLEIDMLLVAGRAGFGTHAVDLIAGARPGQPNSVSMMILAAADPDARSVSARLHKKYVLAPLAKWLGPPDAETRAALITALCSGFLTYHTLMPLKPLTRPVDPVARAWLVQALQDIVDRSAAQ